MKIYSDLSFAILLDRNEWEENIKISFEHTQLACK